MSNSKRIYLDYAAATPVDPIVERAMAPFAADEFANPSSLYTEGRLARQTLDDARHRIAQCLGAKSSEVVLTAGGTEAVNLAILGVGRRFPGAKVVTTAIEHQAVLGCVEALADEGHQTELVKVNNRGLVEPESVERAIDDQTVLVSIGLVNSEIGTIQPLAKIAAIIKEARADRTARGIELPIYLMSDASAAAGLVSLQVSRLGVDLLVLNSAKIYGPKLSGGLYVRTGTDLKPLIYGGGQERGLRSGSQSVGLAVGLATALELADESRIDETGRLAALRDQLKAGLLDIDGVTVNGDDRHGLPNNLNVTIPDVSGEELVYHLDRARLAVATGAACSASSDQPSHVLLAIGLSPEQANQSLRLTLGRPTTESDVATTVTLITNTVKRLRSRLV